MLAFSEPSCFPDVGLPVPQIDMNPQRQEQYIAFLGLISHRTAPVGGLSVQARPKTSGKKDMPRPGENETKKSKHKLCQLSLLTKPHRKTDNNQQDPSKTSNNQRREQGRQLTGQRRAQAGEALLQGWRLGRRACVLAKNQRVQRRLGKVSRGSSGSGEAPQDRPIKFSRWSATLKLCSSCSRVRAERRERPQSARYSWLFSPAPAPRFNHKGHKSDPLGVTLPERLLMSALADFICRARPRAVRGRGGQHVATEPAGASKIKLGPPNEASGMPRRSTLGS